MTGREVLRKGIFPIIAVMLSLVLFYPICVENGVCDYLKLWILAGIPFGIHRMFVWVIPRGFDLGGTLGMWTMNLLVGGVIGGVVLVGKLVLAAFYLLQFAGIGIFRVIKKGLER